MQLRTVDDEVALQGRQNTSERPARQRLDHEERLTPIDRLEFDVQEVDVASDLNVDRLVERLLGAEDQREQTLPLLTARERSAFSHGAAVLFNGQSLLAVHERLAVDAHAMQRGPAA